MSGGKFHLRRWFPHPKSAALLVLCMAAAPALGVSFVPGRAEWEQAAAAALRRGVVLAEIIFLSLLLTLRWWGRRSADPNTDKAASPPAAPGMSGRIFFGALCGLVLLGGALRWPFAHGSMWWDEVWNVRNTIVGEYRPDPKNPGADRFRPTDFKRAAWYYSKPANHPPVSLAAKCCHEIWRRATGAPDGAFDEFILRLPGVLAGLCAVVVVAVLLRAWGMSAAGLCAAFLLAAHPWAIRYSVDARAYAFVMLLVPLGCWLLWKMMQQPDRLRWWWLFGLNQFLLMWCHMLSFYLCLPLTITAAVLFWKKGDGPRGRWLLLSRLVAVNLWGAALLAIMLLPCLDQAMRWAERNQDGNILTFAYLAETLGQITLGTAHSFPPTPEAAGIPTLEHLHGAGPWLGWTGVILFLLLAAAGLIRLRTQQRPAFVMMLGLAAALGIGLAVVVATQFYFYHRFIIGMAGPLVMLAACGATGSTLRQWPGFIAAGGLFVFLTFPQTRLLCSRSSTPWKEAAAWLAEQPAKDKLVTGLGHGGDALEVYFPAAAVAKENDAARLEATARAAAAAGRPFYVCFAYPNLHRANLPDVMRLVEGSGHFEAVWEQGGIEPEFFVRIYRWRP